jgi:DNA invertase Pin-like site-specific DNA recombinase
VFAEFERSMIRERQREGIAEAKRQGKQIGRARKLTEAQVETIKERIAKGESKKALATEMGISRQTLYSALG